MVTLHCLLIKGVMVVLVQNGLLALEPIMQAAVEVGLLSEPQALEEVAVVVMEVLEQVQLQPLEVLTQAAVAAAEAGVLAVTLDQTAALALSLFVTQILS